MPELSETLVVPQEAPTLELDELWSFVLKKANKRWIWIALCRQTRQVVAFVIRRAVRQRLAKDCGKTFLKPFGKPIAFPTFGKRIS
ncbi:MAG TPA: IS1 family transposase [Pyrinomonadaceae bacterium]|nr:IS1 family transposase [Pyrinomonadaceae bacterium]